MERCPICQARFKESICYRCGTDLSLLMSIETQAAAMERRAVTLLALGNLPNAYQLARQALTLKHSPLALALLGLIRRDLVTHQIHTLEQLMQ